MVAVTIILASVVGVYVLGIGSDLTDSSPQSSLEFSHSLSGSANSTTIIHGGGETFSAGTIKVTIDGETVYRDGASTAGFKASPNWSGDVTSGDQLRIQEDGGDIQAGDSVIVLWVGEDSSSIIGESTVS